MKPPLLFAVSFVFVLGATAQDDGPANAERSFRIDIPNTVIQDVLELYSRQVRKPVFMATNVYGVVTMKFTAPSKDVPALMRKSLLENNGIELRELPSGEILAEWSKDPKYPRRTGPVNSGPPVTPKLPTPSQR